MKIGGLQVAIFSSGDIPDTAFLAGVSICQEENWISQAKQLWGVQSERLYFLAPPVSVGFGTSPGGADPLWYLLDLRYIMTLTGEATKCCWFEGKRAGWDSKPSSPKAVSILGCQWEVVACWLFLDVLPTSGFSFLWTRSDWQCRCSNSFSGGLEGSMESAQLWASLLKKKHASCWACHDAAQLQGSGAR